jgi:hypothetical protein
MDVEKVLLRVFTPNSSKGDFKKTSFVIQKPPVGGLGVESNNGTKRQ